MAEALITSIKVNSLKPLSLTLEIDKSAVGSSMDYSLKFKIDTLEGQLPQNKKVEIDKGKISIESPTLTLVVNEPIDKYYSYEGEKIKMYFTLEYSTSGHILNRTNAEIEIPDLNKYTPQQEGENVPEVTLAHKIRHRGILALYQNLPLINRIMLILYVISGLAILGYIFYLGYIESPSIHIKRSDAPQAIIIVAVVFGILITASLRETFKIAKFTLKQTEITKNSRIPLSQIFTAIHKTTLNEVYLRVIAENWEQGTYKNPSSFSHPGRPQLPIVAEKKIRSVLLFEKKIDFIKAGEKIENYFPETVEFNKIFEKLYPNCLIMGNGLELKWYVEILTPTTQTIRLVDNNNNILKFV